MSRWRSRGGGKPWEGQAGRRAGTRAEHGRSGEGILSRKAWAGYELLFQAEKNGSSDGVRESKVLGGARDVRGKGVRCGQWGYVNQTRFLKSLVVKCEYIILKQWEVIKSFLAKVNFFIFNSQTCIRTGLNLIDLLTSYG